MSEASQGEGWWLASDGRWYPPQPPAAPPPPGYAAPGYAAPGYAAPGYAAPGYAAPGYAAPGHAPAGYGFGSGANRGPLGTRERIGIQVLLAVVTLGLYSIYWAYKSHEEVKQHSGEGVGGLLGVVIFIFVGFVTLFLLPLEIKRMYEREGMPSPVGAATAFWVLLFGIPWYVKCQVALNEYWAAKGVPAP